MFGHLPALPVPLSILFLAAMIALLTQPLWRPALIRWQAARAVLRCYPALDTPQARKALLGSRDGLALLTLLCNAAAKQHPHLYRHKVPLLHAVVAASSREEWWAVAHTHQEATSYKDTVLILVDTGIGPILDLSGIQLTAHVSKPDAARYFPNAPEANGRRWAGVPLQARAAEIAAAFIERQK